MNLNPVSKAQDDTAVKKWQTSVKNLLFALLVCSVMFLAEKALVRSVLLTYRRTQFDAKVSESARVVELLSSLYEASCIMFPVYCREFRNDDAIMADSVREPAPADGNRVRNMKNLKYLKDLVPGATGETSGSGGSAHEFTKHAFGYYSARSVVVQALGRKRATEALARRIWMSFVVEGHHALYLEDVIEVLGSERDVEAQECFRTLDRDGNGDISLDEMVLTVAEFGQMRTSLLHSVHDVDQATRVLDRIFITVALILGSLVSVFFVTNTSTTAITAGATSLLGLCFLLSATAHEVLGSCVFLFVKRPFEVGDRVEVEEKSYIVQRISLLYTVFRCVADHRTTQAANNVLNNHWIDNISRASAMREQLTVPANFDTTFDDIQKLREELERFVRDKENCRDFMPDIDIEVAGLGNMDRLELRVDIRHKYNWSNESVRAARRSKFMCALVLALRRIGIRPPGEDEMGSSEKLFAPASADQHEEARGLLSGEVDGPRDPQGSGLDSENQPSARRRGPSHASAEHLNPPSPGPDDEETRYQTPSASPNKRLSGNLNPGMPATSRQSSTGRRKATRSAEGISSGVPIIAEPAPLQRPPAPPSLNYNLHSSYISENQRHRRFSYDAVQPRSFVQMEQCTSPVAGLFSSPGQQRGIRGD
ncbi:serine threonine protein kinase [Aspergillus sp. HF37]|nr:serine threonine protein kinase [Aspergillus sp. HF37]